MRATGKREKSADRRKFACGAGIAQPIHATPRQIGTQVRRFEAVEPGTAAVMNIQKLVHNESLRRRNSPEYKQLLASYGIE